MVTVVDTPTLARLLKRVGVGTFPSEPADRIEGDRQSLGPGFEATGLWRIIAGHERGRRDDAERATR